jgi:hypothetical protein
MSMSAVLGHPAVPAVVSVAVLLIVAAISLHVLRRVRRATNIDHTSAVDLVRNFEEMRREGDINAAEFRTITSVLRKKLARGSDIDRTSGA